MERKRLVHHWKRVPRHVRVPIVLIVGITILAFGAALLVLPGPGWIIIFAGVAVLASEFAFAQRLQTKLVDFAKRSAGSGKRLLSKLFSKNKH